MTASRLRGLGVSAEAIVPLVQHYCRLPRVVDEVLSKRVATNSQHATLCKGITQTIDRGGDLTRTEASGRLASLIFVGQAKGQLYHVPSLNVQNLIKPYGLEKLSVLTLRPMNECSPRSR